MNLAGLGTLGLGMALRNGLSTGLSVGEQFSDYQQERATEESKQFATNEQNMQNGIQAHAKRMMVSSAIPNLAKLLTQAPNEQVQPQQYSIDATQSQQQQNPYVMQPTQSNYGAYIPQATLNAPQVAQPQTLGEMVAQQIQPQLPPQVQYPTQLQFQQSQPVISTAEIARAIRGNNGDFSKALAEAYNVK